MPEETVVEFIRHGEPVGGSRYRGHSIDDPLSERGWSQMWRGVGSADYWDIILTSPLSRCADFAHRLGEERKIPVRILDDLREIGFGAWEGMTKEEVLDRRPEEFRRFYEDPIAHPPENAERVEDFFRRISSIYRIFLDEHSGKKILVVAHAGVIRAALMHAIGAGPGQMYNVEIRNGMISRVRYRNGRTGLELINGTIETPV
ncbi:MAG: histidine phosphatase family protein [Sedimenticolaceae bacterium]|nr:histidine phosphatase family protein [Sedimenticolaceae bacterium]